LLLAVLLSFNLEKNAHYLKEFSLRFAPSPEVVEALSVDQKPLLADLFFAKTAVHLGENYHTPEKRDLDWMYANLDIVTRLDPDFRGAYLFGGIAIPLDKKETKNAIKFLKEGLKRAPLDWHLPFWLGYNYYQLDDYLTAADYFAQAAKLPSCPRFVESVRAMLYYKGDQPEAALTILQALIDSVEKKKDKELIEKKIAWLKNIVELEGAVKKFKEKFSRLPDNLEELVSSGLLTEIPEDKFGQGYYLDKKSGHVKSLFKFVGSNDLQGPPKPEGQTCDIPK